MRLAVRLAALRLPMLLRVETSRARCARVAFALALAAVCPAAEITSAQVQELIEQNRRLQEQVRAQQQTIDALTAKVGEVQKTSERHEHELRGLQDRAWSPGTGASGSTLARSGNREQEVRISAEAGL